MNQKVILFLLLACSVPGASQLVQSGQSQLSPIDAAFKEFNTRLNMGKPPPDSDKFIEYTMFNDHVYQIPKKDFCKFFNEEAVKTKVDGAVKNFIPRNVKWFSNLETKLATCVEDKKSDFNRWTRKLAFNILLYGPKARTYFTRDLEIEPEMASEYRFHSARTYMMEGNYPKYEEALQAALGQKSKDPEKDAVIASWLNLHLAGIKINQGDFAAAEKFLKLVSQSILDKDPLLKDEYILVDFHKRLALKASGRPEPVSVADFCTKRSFSHMRYRELEICLVAEVLLNKPITKDHLVQLEAEFEKLFPLQIPLVALTLFVLKDKGVPVKANLNNAIAQVKLANPDQTMFKYIFEYVDRKRRGANITPSKDPVISVTGKYSLFGLVAISKGALSGGN